MASAQLGALPRGAVLAVMLTLLAAGAVALAGAHDRERAALIAETNAHPGILWTAGENERFRGQPVGASARLNGVKPDHAAVMKRLLEEGTVQYAEPEVPEALPTDFDVATAWPKCAKVVGDIRDQSDCGCCFAFAPSGAASDRLCIATNASVMVPLSAQEACFCPYTFTGDCDGGYPSDPWLHVQNLGLVTGGQYNETGPFGGDGLCVSYTLPHCHHAGPKGNDPYPKEGSKACPSIEDSPKCPKACDDSAKPPYADWKKDRYKAKTRGGVQTFKSGDTASIMASMMAHGSVTASFDVYPDFENYRSGIYHHVDKKKSLGGHAVRVVGWGVEKGVKYWKVANSWNKYWGEDGYFRIVRGTNECTLEDWMMSSKDNSKWSGPGI